MDRIISLTSWAGRIDHIGERLENIRAMCPGWHIVLVLSTDEFPERNVSVPDWAEVLWVYDNTKSFKKVIPTMRKYPDAVIVSADDDMEYKCNFAELLFTKWLKAPACVITNVSNVKHGGIALPNGYCTLYPPRCMEDAAGLLTPGIVATNNDDAFYGVFLSSMGVPMQYLSLGPKVATPLTDGVGLSDTGMYRAHGNDDIKLIVRELMKNPHFSPSNPAFCQRWMS